MPHPQEKSDRQNGESAGQASAPFLEFQRPAHRSISEMEETFRGKCSLFTKDAHELSGGMREARPAPRTEVDGPRHVPCPHFYLLHPTTFPFPINPHPAPERTPHSTL